jgi:hypothetical protein
MGGLIEVLRSCFIQPMSCLAVWVSIWVSVYVVRDKLQIPGKGRTSSGNVSIVIIMRMIMMALLCICVFIWMWRWIHLPPDICSMCVRGLMTRSLYMIYACSLIRGG